MYINKTEIIVHIHCRDALRRLEVMCLMGMEIPLAAVRGLIGAAVDILIHLRRDSCGRRLLTEICELEMYDGKEYRIRPLFQLDNDCRQNEQMIQGHCLRRVGMLSNTQNMVNYGQMEEYLQAMEAFDQGDRQGMDLPGHSDGGDAADGD